MTRSNLMSNLLCNKGVLFLCCARGKSASFDALIEQKKNRLRLTSTPTNSHQIANFRFAGQGPHFQAALDELKQTTPIGYASYMSFTLINLVATSMQIILQVAGFSLFDAYINQLLSFNKVCVSLMSFVFLLFSVFVFVCFDSLVVSQ